MLWYQFIVSCIFNCMMYHLLDNLSVFFWCKTILRLLPDLIGLVFIRVDRLQVCSTHIRHILVCQKTCCNMHVLQFNSRPSVNPTLCDTRQNNENTPEPWWQRLLMILPPINIVSYEILKLGRILWIMVEVTFWPNYFTYLDLI